MSAYFHNLFVEILFLFYHFFARLSRKAQNRIPAAMPSAPPKKAAEYCSLFFEKAA